MSNVFANFFIPRSCAPASLTFTVNLEYKQ